MTADRTVEFKGTGLQGLGWGVLASLLSVLIIPAGWGAASLCRWFVENLSFSDGTRAVFKGRGGEVWGYFIIVVLLGFVPQLSRVIEDPRTSFFVAIGLSISLLPINAAVWLKITRWFFSKIALSCSTDLSFNGRYLPYLGWMLLISLSVYTIVGWAWASVAMLRWVCRNIDGGESEVVFLGGGWSLLWRGFVAALACVLIIPIPWVTVWIIRWFAANMVIKQKILYQSNLQDRNISLE